MLPLINPDMEFNRDFNYKLPSATEARDLSQKGLEGSLDREMSSIAKLILECAGKGERKAWILMPKDPIIKLKLLGYGYRCTPDIDENDIECLLIEW
jgi:hypothetical protein